MAEIMTIPKHAYKYLDTSIIVVIELFFIVAGLYELITHKGSK